MFTVMLHTDWRGFFRSLTPARQRKFERGLVESGLTLGEYMELVERAAMEAFAAHQPSLPGMVDLTAAARGRAVELLVSYSRRKRLYDLLRPSVESLGQARLSGPLAKEVCVFDFMTPGPFPHRGVQLRELRRRIHHRIEEIKRAGD